MNLLTMTQEERKAAICEARERTKNERMGNEPITPEADYLSFILAAYDLNEDGIKDGDQK